MQFQHVPAPEKVDKTALKTRLWNFLRSKTGLQLLLAVSAFAGCLLLWNLGTASPEQMAQVAMRHYAQPEFMPLRAGEDNEARELLRSAFLQQRWESAFYDISRMAPDAPQYAEAIYIEAHIYFLKQDFARAERLFVQAITMKDHWYTPRSLWYAALVALAQGNKGKAIARLRIIAKSDVHPHNWRLCA
jgi:tetratricopeptide (TPR) repeat protein